VADISPTEFQFQEYGTYDEFLTLIFNSVPGTLITYESGLTQYPSGYGTARTMRKTFLPVRRIRSNTPSSFLDQVVDRVVRIGNLALPETRQRSDLSRTATRLTMAG
jgi:hypothetical protein